MGFAKLYCSIFGHERVGDLCFRCNAKFGPPKSKRPTTPPPPPPQCKPSPRKPIAITLLHSPPTTHTQIVCDDGTIWDLTNFDEGWEQLPDVPQPEEEK